MRQIIHCYLCMATLMAPLCASTEEFEFPLTDVRISYIRLAEAILNCYGIDPAIDFPKPEFLPLAKVEDPKWIRGITLIVAGVIAYRYSKTVGVLLIKWGFTYLGWEYYNFVCDYIKEMFNVNLENLIEKPKEN